MRNIEIKAKVQNVVELIQKAKNIAGTDPVTIIQNDVFFNSSQGRLKLRKFEDGNGELIYYDRPDIEGPKLSFFERINVESENINSLTSILSAALGKRCTIDKVRKLFLIDQTRVHIDAVKDLGDFMELEVVLRDDQTPEEGQQIANDLMKKLGVQKSDLISIAYADLLAKKINSNDC